MVRFTVTIIGAAALLGLGIVFSVVEELTNGLILIVGSILLAAMSQLLIKEGK